MKNILSLFPGMALLLLAQAAGGQTLVFRNAQNIIGDADASATGTALYGYHWNDASQTMNGVTFAQTTITEGNIGADLTLTSFGSRSGGNTFGSTTNPYNSLSTAYKGILGGAVYNVGDVTATMQMNGLTAGRQYLAQVFVNDARSATATRTQNVFGANTKLVDYNQTNAAGSPGQHITAYFTPSSTSTSFTVNGSAIPQINAIQVRDVTNFGWWSGANGSAWDEATTQNFSVDGAGTLGTFATAKASVPNVYFADTQTFGGIGVTQNTVDIVSGGVTGADVWFLNNTVTYTINSADASGITGSANVIVQGGGTVNFAGNHSYAGTTYLQSGTLNVGTGGTAGSLGTGGTVNNGILVFNRSDDLSYAGAISGTGTLTKTGAGALTLTGVSNYTGGTTVSTGTLRLGDGTTNPTVNSTYDIAGGATLRLQYNASGSVAQTWSKFTGAGTLALTSGKSSDTGWGILTLPNAFTGTLVMERGRSSVLAASPNNHGLGGTTKVVVRPNGHFGMWENGTTIPASVSFELEGTGYGEANYEAALRMANTASTTTIQGPVTLTGNATIGATGTGVIAQGIGESASASLTVGTAGLNGTIELLGAAAYTGATNINRGTLLLSGGNNRLPTGTTVNFTGASTLNIGATSQTLAHLTVANGITGTVNGVGGTLTITGTSDFRVGGNAQNQDQTLNLSGLSNFYYTGNASRTFSVGPQFAATSTTGGDEDGILYLANNNQITAGTFDVGGLAQYEWSADNNVEAAQVHLGHDNLIHANNIYVGAAGGPDGLLQFRAGLAANPTLTIRAADGMGRASWQVGNVRDVYRAPYTKVDLTTGVSGASQLDALIGTLDIYSVVGSSATADFIMGGGLLDATTIRVAYVGDHPSYNNLFTGRFYLNGGTVKVQTLQMTQDSGDRVSGQFHLNSGAVYAQSITVGNGESQHFYWTSGTIGNYDASTNLTIASGFETFQVTGAGSFNISPGRSGTINQGISGGGSISKLGEGSLVLSAAANTYSGATLVNAGTFTLTGGLTGGTAITVNNDAVFTQSAAGGISGAASFTHNSSATSTLAGVNTYSNPTAVERGTLLVNGSLASAGMITVASGATLGGMGSAGNASLAGGAFLAPGLLDFSENQIALSSLSLSEDSVLLFDLDLPNSLANLTPSFNSDHVALNGALVLDGKLRINPLAGFDPDPDFRWILMTYPAGASHLTDRGLVVDLANSPGLPAPPTGFIYAIDTSTDGYVFLSLAVPEPGAGALLAMGLLLLRRRFKGN